VRRDCCRWKDGRLRSVASEGVTRISHRADANKSNSRILKQAEFDHVSRARVVGARTGSTLPFLKARGRTPSRNGSLTNLPAPPTAAAGNTEARAQGPQRAMRRAFASEIFVDIYGAEAANLTRNTALGGGTWSAESLRNSRDAF